jgi:hypothetical protein
MKSMVAAAVHMTSGVEIVPFEVDRNSGVESFSGLIPFGIEYQSGLSPFGVESQLGVESQS